MGIGSEGIVPGIVYDIRGMDVIVALPGVFGVWRCDAAGTEGPVAIRCASEGYSGDIFGIVRVGGGSSSKQGWLGAAAHGQCGLGCEGAIGCYGKHLVDSIRSW